MKKYLQNENLCLGQLPNAKKAPKKYVNYTKTCIYTYMVYTRIYIWYATIVLFVAMGCVLKTNIFVFIVRLLESFAWKIEIIVNY